MTEIVVRLSLLTEFLLDGCTRRSQAVDTIRKLYRMPDGEPIPDWLAVQTVEAYYAQNGGKPWSVKNRKAAK